MNYVVIFLIVGCEGINLWCPLESCPDMIKGDNRCNPECMISYCNYDTNLNLDGKIAKENSDCYSKCINLDGCDPENLGNGICDNSCNTENCGFDWGDCTCAPGCFEYMLGDGNCNEECNNWSCDLDNHDCGACAPGCFPNMLSNAVCDSECNNEDCLYDYNDCQCAPGCLATDYGNCKPECMVGNCNYDRVSQFPNSWCNDNLIAIYSYYQQVWRDDYSFVPHFEDCWEASNQTCTLEMATDLWSCYWDNCFILECNLGYGNCGDWTDACLHTYDANNNLCLDCDKDLGLHWVPPYQCSRATGYSYVTLTPGDEWAAYPFNDTSSAQNPHLYFFRSASDVSVMGNGTNAFPYKLISDLSQIIHANSTVYLLDGDDFIAQTPIAWYLGDSPLYAYAFADQLLKNLRWKHTKITTLNGEKVRIRRHKDDSKSSTFWFLLENSADLEINNVIFDWEDTVSTCNSGNYCDYCASISYNSTTKFYYNDRNEVINEFLASTWCQKSNDWNFFKVLGSNLVLNNVDFINFRSGFNSLIYVENGNVTLNNVTFDNIYINPGSNSGVIVWNSQLNTDFDAGNLKFENGVVRRLNNGYELGDAINTRGFLLANNITSAVFRNVNFSYNLVFKQQSSSTSTSMLFLNLFKEFRIDSCTFKYNYCDSGIVNIQQDYVYFQPDINDLGEIIYSKLNNVYIKNSNFTSNYGNSVGILYSVHKYQRQNYFIEDSSFIMNGVENGPLIHIECSNSNTNYLVDTTMSVSLSNGSMISANYLSNWVKIYNSNFIENYSGGNGIFEIVNMLNIEMQNTNMISNGLVSSEIMNINTIILNYFIQESDIYLKLASENPSDLNCLALSSISDSINLYMKDLNIQENYCKNNPPNFIISNVKNSTIDSSYFFENNGIGSDGISLAISGNYLTTIKNSKFYSNQNRDTGSPGVISSSSSLLIQNCLFYDNIGTGSLYFSGQDLSIISSLFSSNKSPSSYGGAIYFLISLDNVGLVSLSVTNTSFTNNYCYLNGGGIFIHRSNSLENLLTILITDTNFTDNQALSGSSIYIDDKILVSADSSVKNCIFQANQARFSGTVSVFYIYGVLSFENCYYNENFGVHSSALIISIGENAEIKPSKISINYCAFRFNVGDKTISVENSRINSTLEINESTFEYNTGSILSLDFDYATVRNSKIQHNYSPNPGGALNIINSAILNSENSIYKNNTSRLDGGAISLSSGSQFFCFSCIFEGNYANNSGGAIHADSDAQFSIVNSLLSNNSCKVSGSAIYLASTSNASFLNTSEIAYNYAYSESTISVSSSQILISSAKFSNNSAEKNPSIILEDSKITILDTDFSSQKGEEGCFINLGTSSAKIINSRFFNGFSSMSGVAIHATSSNIEVYSSNFSDLHTSLSQGVIYLDEESTINVEKSIFMNIDCSLDISSSSSSISNTIFKNYSDSAILAIDADLGIKNSEFLDGTGANGGAIYCSDCNEIEIYSSSFINNLAENGGALYISSQASNPESYQLTINSSSFMSNIAGNGGAIWANNINLYINSSDFIENRAEASQTESLQEIIDGIGGGIKISCENSASKCIFNFSSNSFSNNSATYNGGAINWDNSKPLFDSNIFTNNSAQYGNNIASFPTMIIFLGSSSQQNADVKAVSNNSTDLTLNNVASGQDRNPPLVFALVDDINQVITTDIKSQAQMQSSNEKVIVSGSSITSSKNGILYFEGYIIEATPGSNANITLTTSSINVEKSATSANTLPMSKNFEISVDLRYCEVGEATIGLSCEVCPKSYYNIDPKKTKCSDCPSSAICYGNYTMIPKSGHWRDNKFTDKFWKCPYPSACLGSPDSSNLSYTGVCKKGYEGNMCHACEKGYSRLYKNECEACLDTASNVIRWLGIFILLILITVIIIKTARNSAFKPESFSSIYIKIFWNYLQIITIIGTFNFNWPYEVVGFFYIGTSIDYIVAQLFSFDCALQSSFPKIEVYYGKLLITCLTPYIIAIACLLIWIIIDLIRRKSIKKIKNDYISTCVVLLFLLHPGIASTTFDIFSCKEINPGEFWLNSDLGIRCWDQDHLYYAFLLALPTIFIWVIGIPTLTLMNLIKKRRTLNAISMKVRYGFLVNGYDPKRYYWEFVVLYYKIILISFSTFLSNVYINIQALTVSILLSIFLHIQVWNKPYNRLFFNKTENFSRFVALITILIGLIFLTNDLDTISTKFLVVILLVSNSTFILYILLSILYEFAIVKRIFSYIVSVFCYDKKRLYIIQDTNSVCMNEESRITSTYKTAILNSTVLNDMSLFEKDPNMSSFEKDPNASEKSELVND